MIELPDSELKKVQEKDIESFLKELLDLLALKSTEYASSKHDTFQFQFALKELTCSVLEKRYAGLVRVNQLIELAEKKSFTSGNYNKKQKEEIPFSLSEE